jgi:large subunit ribosomal protein L24
MKRKFSRSWKASKQPRKQRKYLANAPLHLRKKLVGSNLSKDLRAKHKMRNIPVKKGDKVKIMRGKFAKKEGKVLEVKLKTGKIYIEGMQVKKQEGSKVNVPFKASNLQIIEMNMEGKKRIKGMKVEVKAEKKEAPKKETKVQTKTMEKKK